VAEAAAPVPTQDIRRHAAFIHKHILPQVTRWRPRLPVAPRGDDVRPTLFVGVYFFL
jgi:hypothetical protein